jgi:signal transduction histidine kinase
MANTPINVPQVAERWHEQLSGLAASKQLDFAVKIDPGLPEVIYGDEEAISKVVLNLLSNAIKFTHEGGVDLNIGVQDSMWTIQVTDTGIGIPPHARAYIFDEFRQVDQSSKRLYGGTGLGLAIVQKMTRAMGGTVALKSEVGKGSTFTIALPLQKNPA